MSCHRNQKTRFRSFFLVLLLLCLGTGLKAQSQEVPAEAKAPAPYQQASLRRFTFKHAKAADVLKIVQQLAGDTAGIAVDERTNSLVFLADDERTRELEESYTLLDAETPRAADAGKGFSLSVPALGPTPLAFDFSNGIEREDSVESLKQRYGELEQQAHQLADKLKRSTSLSETQRTELQLAVRKSFEARQALQRSELTDLARRMKGMQQSIDMRDKLAEKVIQRRVEDLLNPNLNWDHADLGESTALAAGNSTPYSAIAPTESAATVPTAEATSKPVPPEWNDFLKLLPESGTALVMFSFEPETREQMLPVAKKVAEAASAQFVELPLTQWRKILSPEATHFVLMKDRQLVGTRTGLMTETRLQDFVAKAKDWLTPRSTGIDENSLVRIDCYISPGTNNIGSQHGGAYPLTTAVIAVHEGQALLLGPESIGEYIAMGYSCVAIARDATGKQKQVPLDIVLKGPVKLLERAKDTKRSLAAISVTLDDGTVSEVPLAGIESIYPKSVTEPQDAYDVGSAIYHIRGVHGLTPVKLAAVDDAPKIDQRVLSGSFTRDQHFPPLHGFRSPIQWQAQLVKSVGSIYGGNMNGAELFDVLCPTLPAPCGFTFNERGRLIGRYGLGSPSEKDMTHTVFKPDTTHSVLLAALEEIEDVSLKAAFAQTLEESQSSASAKIEKTSAADGAVDGKSSQPSTSPPSKFDTPQALLARLDKCSQTGSYEEFVALFTDEGVRDLAGSLMVSAMQMTAMADLAKQNGGDSDLGTMPIHEVLKRWSSPNPTQEQQQAAGDALSTMFGVAFGGPAPQDSAIRGFIDAIRKSAERVTDHRKFSVGMMNAYQQITGEPFGYFDAENADWQVSQFGENALATLVVRPEPSAQTAGTDSTTYEHNSSSNGSAQTPELTLKKVDGTWRVFSLFKERLNKAEPTSQVPSTPDLDPSTSKTITKRYSVGSFVTESYFVGKGSYDLKEVYDKYETDIEQSLQDLAKTVTAACTQPPKFVQVLSSSRCLLVGHTATGHQEIADFMSNIGITNDRIRLRGDMIAITWDEAKTLGIELTQHALSPHPLSTDQVEKLLEFSKGKQLEAINKRDDLTFFAMDEIIYSGTQTPVKMSVAALQWTIAARLIPNSNTMQIRMDMGTQYFVPRFQTLSDGQSVLFSFGDDHEIGLFWLATAEIVREKIVGAEKLTKKSKYNDDHCSPLFRPSDFVVVGKLLGECDRESENAG